MMSEKEEEKDFEFEFNKFYNKATERYGELFTIKPIQVKEEDLEKFNIDHVGTLTKEDLENYKAIWLLKNECPNCGEALDGLFGGFVWGLVHGNGYCGHCKKISFKLYHYIGDIKKPLMAYSLIGF